MQKSELEEVDKLISKRLQPLKDRLYALEPKKEAAKKKAKPPMKAPAKKKKKPKTRC